MMEILQAGARRLGLEFGPGQLEQYEAYYRALVDWNRRVNLTAITGYEAVQVKHFLDSLTVALAWRPGADSRLIDVGTGGGIPGIPLKLAFPGLSLVLLEAAAKKARFLDHICRELGLDGVEVVVGRAEAIAHQAQYREAFDLVLSRAVATLPALVELALPFCAVGGCFIAQKKGNIDEEIGQAGKAIEALGGRLREVKKINLAEFGDERSLVVVAKVAPTPSRYPRRPGMPAKRPIA